MIVKVIRGKEDDDDNEDGNDVFNDEDEDIDENVDLTGKLNSQRRQALNWGLC